MNIFFGILTAASMAYFLVAIFAALRFFSSQPSSNIQHPTSNPNPPVSILIPLCGADFRAYENYVSLCLQDYPHFQIVFGVRDPNDSSISLISRLKADFPHIPIDLAVSTDEIGPNPKVNNLNNMLPLARNETLFFLDSDIRVGPDFLKTVSAELDRNGGGLVTCLYRAAEAPGIASKLEAAGISAEFAPGVLVAQLGGGISFAFGAAIALSRQTLEKIGGFRAIADFLADDYMLGHLVRKAGLPVNLSKYVVRTVLPKLSFWDFISHQVRWARGVRACSPWGHAGSIITNGTVLALFFLFSGFSGLSGLLLLAVLALRLVMARIVAVDCLGDEIVRRNLFLIPLRDLFSFFIWCSALFGNRILWRGKAFSLRRDGTFQPIDSKPRGDEQ
jgi:ceramide glucosyltransferase